MSGRVARGERLYAVGVLVLSTTALIPLLASGTSLPDAGGDPTSQKLWLAVYVVFAVLVARRLDHLLELARRQKLVFGLAALALASTAWSSAPDVTLRRASALVLTTVIALYFVERFSVEELLDVVAWSLAAIVLLSVVFALARPSYGLDPAHPGAWRGVFTTKNELGRLGAFATLFWLLRLLAHRGPSLVAAAVTLAAVAATWLSGSRTSLVMVAAIVSVALALPILRAETYAGVAGVMFMCAGALAAGVWLFDHQGVALGVLGADSSFTGRTEIWTAVWQSIQVHPVRGYGYGAFWLGPTSPAQAVWSRLGQTPPHAHNGILDVWLQLGALGVGALILWLLRGLRDSWALMRGGGIARAWPFLFLALLIGTNLTESSFLGRNSFIWIVAIAAAAHASRARVQHAPAVARPRAARVLPEAA